MAVVKLIFRQIHFLCLTVLCLATIIATCGQVFASSIEDSLTFLNQAPQWGLAPRARCVAQTRPSNWQTLRRCQKAFIDQYCTPEDKRESAFFDDVEIRLRKTLEDVLKDARVQDFSDLMGKVAKRNGINLPKLGTDDMRAWGNAAFNVHALRYDHDQQKFNQANETFQGTLDRLKPDALKLCQTGGLGSLSSDAKKALGEKLLASIVETESLLDQRDSFSSFCSNGLSDGCEMRSRFTDEAAGVRKNSYNGLMKRNLADAETLNATVEKLCTDAGTSFTSGYQALAQESFTLTLSTKKFVKKYEELYRTSDQEKALAKARGRVQEVLLDLINRSAISIPENERKTHFDVIQSTVLAHEARHYPDSLFKADDIMHSDVLDVKALYKQSGDWDLFGASLFSGAFNGLFDTNATYWDMGFITIGDGNFLLEELSPGTLLRLMAHEFGHALKIKFGNVSRCIWDKYAKNTKAAYPNNRFENYGDHEITPDWVASLVLDALVEKYGAAEMRPVLQSTVSDICHIRAPMSPKDDHLVGYDRLSLLLSGPHVRDLIDCGATIDSPSVCTPDYQPAQ